MIRLFFPKMTNKISESRSTEENRELLFKYFDKHIVLWMFWSLFFMVYVNYEEVFLLSDSDRFDVVIASIGHYLFLIQSFLAICLSKILKLNEEEADILCRAIRGEKYKD